MCMPVSFPTNRIRAWRHVGGHWMVTAVVAVSVSSLFVAVVADSEGPLGRDGQAFSWNRVSEEEISLFEDIYDTVY